MIVGGPCEKTTCSDPPVKDKRLGAGGGGGGGVDIGSRP
jgi:hypothetical protein